MNVVSRERNGIPILEVEGEITIYDAAPLEKEIRECFIQKKNDIIFDLRKVPFMDSSGLGVVLKTIMEVQKRNGSLRVLCARNSVEILLFNSLKSQNPEDYIFYSEEEIFS
jgi:anti-sigma B factor antagonist